MPSAPSARPHPLFQHSRASSLNRRVLHLPAARSVGGLQQTPGTQKSSSGRRPLIVSMSREYLKYRNMPKNHAEEPHAALTRASGGDGQPHPLGLAIANLRTTSRPARRSFPSELISPHRRADSIGSRHQARYGISSWPTATRVAPARSSHVQCHGSTDTGAPCRRRGDDFGTARWRC